jgi:hypothetical protein
MLGQVPGEHAKELAAETCARNGGFKSVHFFVGTEELTSPKISTSQDAQDLLISHVHGGNPGFFVDLAANDAVHISNTFTLERDFGWTGVCIEVNPKYLWNLARRRCTVVAAVVSDRSDQNISFAMNDCFGAILGSGLHNYNAGRSENKFKFRTVTLAQVLELVHAPAVIGYMSLDVEGSEHLVLKNFPFDRYMFTMLTVERPSRVLRTLLVSKGYVFVCCLTVYVDTLYAHNSVVGTEIGTRLMTAVQSRQHRSKCWLNRASLGHPLSERFPGLRYESF